MRQGDRIASGGSDCPFLVALSLLWRGYALTMAVEALPGEELVQRRLGGLRRRDETVEALLVSIGAPRLRSLGFDVPAPFDEPSAHGRYNALVRQLVSFERAAACRTD